MLSMDEILLLENYPILTKPWDSPCLICDYLDQCNVGAEFNPIGCPWLNHYIGMHID